jgi:hypothetical protein
MVGMSCLLSNAHQQRTAVLLQQQQHATDVYMITVQYKADVQLD